MFTKMTYSTQAVIIFGLCLLSASHVDISAAASLQKIDRVSASNDAIIIGIQSDNSVNFDVADNDNGELGFSQDDDELDFSDEEVPFALIETVVIGKLAKTATEIIKRILEVGPKGFAKEEAEKITSRLITIRNVVQKVANKFKKKKIGKAAAKLVTKIDEAIAKIKAKTGTFLTIDDEGEDVRTLGYLANTHESIEEANEDVYDEEDLTDEIVPFGATDSIESILVEKLTKSVNGIINRIGEVGPKGAAKKLAEKFTKRLTTTRNLVQKLANKLGKKKAGKAAEKLVKKIDQAIAKIKTKTGTFLTMGDEGEDVRTLGYLANTHESIEEANEEDYYEVIIDLGFSQDDELDLSDEEVPFALIETVVIGKLAKAAEEIIKRIVEVGPKGIAKEEAEKLTSRLTKIRNVVQKVANKFKKNKVGKAAAKLVTKIDEAIAKIKAKTGTFLTIEVEDEDVRTLGYLANTHESIEEANEEVYDEEDLGFSQEYDEHDLTDEIVPFGAIDRIGSILVEKLTKSVNEIINRIGEVGPKGAAKELAEKLIQRLTTTRNVVQKLANKLGKNKAGKAAEKLVKKIDEAIAKIKAKISGTFLSIGEEDEDVRTVGSQANMHVRNVDVSEGDEEEEVILLIFSEADDEILDIVFSDEEDEGEFSDEVEPYGIISSFVISKLTKAAYKLIRRIVEVGPKGAAKEIAGNIKGRLVKIRNVANKIATKLGRKKLGKLAAKLVEVIDKAIAKINQKISKPKFFSTGHWKQEAFDYLDDSFAEDEEPARLLDAIKKTQ